MSYLIESARHRAEIGLLAEGESNEAHALATTLGLATSIFGSYSTICSPAVLDAAPVAGVQAISRQEAIRAPLGTSPCPRSFRERPMWQGRSRRSGKPNETETRTSQGFETIP